MEEAKEIPSVPGKILGGEAGLPTSVLYALYLRSCQSSLSLSSL